MKNKKLIYEIMFYKKMKAHGSKIIKIFQLCAFSVLILFPVGLWHLFRFIEFYIAFFVNGK